MPLSRIRSLHLNIFLNPKLESLDYLPRLQSIVAAAFRFMRLTCFAPAMAWLPSQAPLRAPHPTLFTATIHLLILCLVFSFYTLEKHRSPL